MIMVDPKRVELTPFNGIPHLVMPVIVEPDEVYDALRGLINEMTNRYRLMEEIGVRNISGYNDKSADPMPFLVLIVDELADLMMTGGLEVEQQLVRLAQLGRAAGIHMVLATQRPSVKVVTGLLKANVPARVAFAVASQVDSRVILDTAGAEVLMGKGDLLLQNNDYPKARRGQGTLVFDDETDRVIEFWRGQIGPPLKPINLEVGAASPSTDDELDNNGIDDVYEGDILQRARDMALRNPRINSAMLERRLKIRKSIADEIMEELHGEGLVIEV
jgi:S-DNA-T family DNA segregation ATPase FtsK/SpoIIIE